MTESAQFFCFSNGRLAPVTRHSDSDVQLSAADSWLVEDGRSVNAQAHFARFAKWVTETSASSANQLAPFFDAVIENIPAQGRWFPRLEFHAEALEPNNLFFRLREAPEQLSDIILWTSPEPDPRANPAVKGPDLSLCLQLRRAAKMHGADEAVLLDPQGYLIEGALSSLVWWRGEVLCAPDDQTSWLPSVTRSEVFSIANEMGIATRTEHVKPADLVGLEIWSLSSLHGIRPVTDWVNLGSPVGKATHTGAFMRRLRLHGTALR